MKTIRIFLLIALPILILAACSPTPAATVNAPAPQTTAVQAPVVADTAVPAPVVTETSAPAAVVTEPAATAVTLSDAEMEALITEKAKTKHTLEFILSQNKTAEEWSVTLDRMVGNGAKINAEEKELIINWLVGRKK